MSTDITPDGYPFPLGDDPVQLGDNRIRELAEALTGRTFTRLTTDSLTPDTAPEGWPVGVSYMAVGNAGGWPRAISGTVVTQRFFTDRALQIYYARGSSNALAYFRIANTGATWSAWAGLASPPVEAMGAVPLQAPAGATAATAVVALPNGLFTAPPDVLLTGIYSGSGSSGTVIRGHSATATSIAITVAGLPAGGNSVGHWRAAQRTIGGPQAFAAQALDLSAARTPASTSTCRTDWCPENGIPILLFPYWIDEDGIEHPCPVMCGTCGQPTELTNPPDPEPDENP